MKLFQKQMGVIIADDIEHLFRTLSNLTGHEWELLEKLINSTQNNFVDKLRYDYPQLSKDDIQVVMLLRTHLTHEQIAQINHVELSSFRKRRCRIKQKMQIDCPSFSLFIKNLYVD